MTCTKNYENWSNFVKVLPKILVVVSFVFPNSQGSVATQLRCGGKYYLYLVRNFMHFPAASSEKW